jgi:hypothetical protein
LASVIVSGMVMSGVVVRGSVGLARRHGERAGGDSGGECEHERGGGSEARHGEPMVARHGT